MSAVPSYREIIERRQRMGMVQTVPVVRLDLIRPAKTTPEPQPEPVCSPAPEPRPSEVEAKERETVYERPSRIILREVCEAHSLPVWRVLGKEREWAVVNCRTEVAARLAKETKLSYPQIGRVLGMDHSSIIMCVRRWNEQTGENVRNAGVISPAKRARDRKNAMKMKDRQRAERPA